jgi:hypothetical protein
MTRIDKKRLVRVATRARERAVAPDSKFNVGTTLVTKAGKIIYNTCRQLPAEGCPGAKGWEADGRAAQNQAIYAPGTVAFGDCHSLKFLKRTVGYGALVDLNET